MEIIAKTFAGLEEVLVNEIEKIGGINTKILKRSVSFEGDTKVLYTANYVLRTALKILVPIFEFNFENIDEFYQNIFQYAWEDKFKPQKTIAIDSVVFSDEFKNTHFAELKAKDAIVDRFKDKFNRRPNVDIKSSDVKINLYIKDNFCSVSLDSSGDALFKRGYRQQQGLAPLNEVLASGIIQLSDWNTDIEFLDFMCGSGTLPIEAALYGMNIPSQFFRKRFAFQNWNDYDEQLWKSVVNENIEKQSLKQVSVFASDISPRAIDEATENIISARLSPYINIQKRSFDKVFFNSQKHIVFNPPYDKRIKTKGESIEQFYKKIGDSLKRNFIGSDAWFITGNLDALKHVGLKTSKRIVLYNGPIESRLVKYELY